MALSRHLLRAPRLLTQCQKLAVASNVRHCETKARDPSELSLTFTTPSEVFYRDVVVKQVDVPTQASDIGVMATHVPTIGVLKPGVVVVYGTDGAGSKYFVGGGAVTVNNDSTIQILAEEAHPLDRFDAQAVAASLQKAQSDLGSAASEEEKAQVQIQIECLDALKTAIA